MRILTVFAVLALLCAGLAGCDGSSGVTGPEEGPPAAYQFHHDTPKLIEDQTECIVCRETPIKENLYEDWGPGLRVYFDKQECKEEFQQNPDQYVNQFRQQKDEEMRQMQEDAMTRPEE